MITANIISSTKAVLTVEEAARYMGISRSTLYKYMMRGEIPYSKPCGKVAFFSRVELEEWMMSNRIATVEEIEQRAHNYCIRKGGAL